MDPADSSLHRAVTVVERDGHRPGRRPGRWLEPEELWDLHGPALYSMACLVLEDETDAMLAVTRGLVDVYRSPHPEATLRSAARQVHRHCCTLAPDVRDATTWLPSRAEARELARSQRSALALCLFGAHTYGEAATELGLSRGVAARLLISGIRELTGTATPPVSRIAD